jgi:hypothetical protein
MVILGGAGVLVVAVCLHIAWVAKRAVARGRNAWAWVALALALGGAGLRAGVALFLKIADVDNDALMAIFGTAPITLTLAPMIVIVLVLNALPVHVATMNAYPVFAQEGGAGMLVIGPEEIVLRWPTRNERFPRAGLVATADQESVRLAWPDRELLVMPTGKPATREGRVRQAQAIAARLGTNDLPRAQVIDGERPDT